MAKGPPNVEKREDLELLLPQLLVESHRYLRCGNEEIAQHLGVSSFTIRQWQKRERKIAHPKMLLLAIISVYLSLGQVERGWYLYRRYISVDPSITLDTMKERVTV